MMKTSKNRNSFDILQPDTCFEQKIFLFYNHQNEFHNHAPELIFFLFS